MIFSCNANLLQVAVNNVSKAVALKSTIPSLDGILIKASNNTLFLCGYDLELGITTSISAQIQEEGEIVFQAKIFADMLRTLNSSEIKVEVDDKNVAIISSGESQFKIMGISTEEYPELPTVSAETAIELSQNLLKSMIRQTKFAVATDDNNPVQKGILFNIENSQFQLVAVDGYRLAIRKEDYNDNENIKSIVEETINFVVPAKTLNEVIKLLADDDTMLTIKVGRKHIIFTIDDYCVISRLLEGDFFNYKNAINSPSNSEVKISTKRFIEGVDRMSLMISDRLKSPICCEFSNKLVRLSCETALGGAVDKFEINSETMQPMAIGFNNRYLSEALKATEKDEVKLLLNGPQKPIKIVPTQSDEFLYLVLPVRLNVENQ